MKRRSQEEWQRLIQQQLDSGLKASQFCKEHGLCEKYFSTVKYKLKKKTLSPKIFQRVDVFPTLPGIQLQIGALTMTVPVGVDSKWLADLAKHLCL